MDHIGKLGYRLELHATAVLYFIVDNVIYKYTSEPWPLIWSIILNLATI